MKRRKGFTLIELLVVIVIISVITTIAIATLNQNDIKRVENTADELAQVLTLTAEQAMLQPAVISITIKENKLTFGENNSLTPFILPDDMVLTIEQAGEELPQIIFSTNGDVTPFTLHLGKKGTDFQVVIRGSADGTIVKEKSS